MEKVYTYAACKGTDPYAHLHSDQAYHYEKMPIQIYWKIYHQKMKILR